MPLTPFIGLSVMVHIFVIIGYHVINRIPKRKFKLVKKEKIGNSKFNTYICFSIVVSVFIAVAVNAAILVWASVVEKHSSVKFVANYIYKTNTIALAEENFSSKTVVVPECPNFHTLAVLNNGSLVDYMKAKGIDASFESRFLFAEGLGIENYKGSYNENHVLLRNLFVSSGELLEGDLCK